MKFPFTLMGMGMGMGVGLILLLGSIIGPVTIVYARPNSGTILTASDGYMFCRTPSRNPNYPWSQWDEDGSWVLHKSIVDPRGEPVAFKAISTCFSVADFGDGFCNDHWKSDMGIAHVKKYETDSAVLSLRFNSKKECVSELAEALYNTLDQSNTFRCYNVAGVESMATTIESQPQSRTKAWDQWRPRMLNSQLCGPQY